MWYEKQYAKTMLTILLYDYQSIIKYEIYLESVYTPKGYRGFESLSFRKKTKCKTLKDRLLQIFLRITNVKKTTL